MKIKEVIAYNRRAWDEQVRKKNRWTRPVSSAEIVAAKKGNWQVLLTPQKPVPRDWFPKQIEGAEILALACGGGQQGPLFAACGARVIVFDNSGAQLEQDMMVAERDGLEIQIAQGDMSDLSRFSDKSFDIIFNPVSNCFIPDPNPVWRECFRVLRPAGTLLTGFANPVLYLFGDELYGFADTLRIKFQIPYSDLSALNPEQINKGREMGLPLEFGHALEDQIGGLLKAGFIISGFYEDRNSEEDCEISHYIATFMAVRAIKPG